MVGMCLPTGPFGPSTHAPQPSTTYPVPVLTVARPETLTTFYPLSPSHVASVRLLPSSVDIAGYSYMPMAPEPDPEPTTSATVPTYGDPSSVTPDAPDTDGDTGRGTPAHEDVIDRTDPECPRCGNRSKITIRLHCDVSTGDPVDTPVDCDWRHCDDCHCLFACRTGRWIPWGKRQGKV